MAREQERKTVKMRKWKRERTRQGEREIKENERGGEEMPERDKEERGEAKR